MTFIFNRGKNMFILKLFSQFPKGYKLRLLSVNPSSLRYFSSKKTAKSYSNISVCIGTVVAACVGYKIFDNVRKPIQQMHLDAAVLPPDLPTESVRQKFNFVADVAEKIIPSVVYIEIQASHPLLHRSIPVSNGSGFIVKSDGLILTNAHVVENHANVTVRLHDGRTFQGVVEDSDYKTDLATVRINATNLPVLPLGTSSKLRVGEFVIAMGNPLTLSHSITVGVVSSVNRQSKELGLHQMTDYIQTDAAINVGNSGGPLVNLDGEAIGINTMKVGEGISFAIPSDNAVDFLKRAEEKRNKGWFKSKKESTPSKKHYIGITMLSLTPNIIQELQLRNPDFPTVDHGVLVWRIMQGSPAQQAGMRAGDIITSINKSKVVSASDVYKFLSRGETLSIDFVRGSRTYSATVYPQAPSS